MLTKTEWYKLGARTEVLDGSRKAEVTYHYHAERTARDPDLGVCRQPGEPVV